MVENGDPATGSTDIHGLSDDLLELILLRVGSPVCLARAAATCKPWRRVICGAGFPGRHRSLHGPLGHYDATSHGRRIVFVPSSPSSSSSPPHLDLDLRRRLRLSGLVPAGVLRRSTLTDCRGGLLAAVSITDYGDADGAVVCDPWTGQYRRAGLLWRLRSEDSESFGYCLCHCLGAFIVDAGGGNGGAHHHPVVPDMSRFRVMYAHLLQNSSTGRVTGQACVFSAGDSRWLRPVVSTDLGVFDWDVETMDIHKSFLGRAGGSLFWSSPKGGVVFAVDEGTGKFSTSTLPAAAGVGGGTNVYDRGNLRVIGDGGGGTVRMVRLAGGDELEVLAVARQAGGGKCVVERRAGVSLLSGIDDGGADWQSSSSSWRFVDEAAAGHGRCAAVMSPDKTHVLLLSVDAQTEAVKLEQAGKELARLLVSDRRLFPYELTWPPTISRSST